VRKRMVGFRSALAAMVLTGWALVGALASACTIPVFRYALERWEADRLLVIVYHNTALTPQQDHAVNELTRRSSPAGGPLNIEVIRYDVSAAEPLKLGDVRPPDDRPLPWVEIRLRLNVARTAVRWQGPLEEATGQSAIFDSPARREIVRRLLNGDSAVWLLVAPKERVQGLSEQLQAKLDAVATDLVVPQGIGLPGSELYAAIPLQIRFSVLAVSHTAAEEQLFLQQLAASAAEWRTDAAYVVPVFGRCRALDVFRFDEADELLVQDVGEFLCGACSCQVKQANPGFDLLTSVDWNQRLFGESIPERITGQLTQAGEIRTSGMAPEYVTVPAGNTAAIAAEAKQAARTQSVAPENQVGMLSRIPSPGTGLLLAMLSLIIGAIVTCLILVRR
jgi:hypothetical protein